nr:hypothetical protein [Desulfolucanica intricata]
MAEGDEDVAISCIKVVGTHRQGVLERKGVYKVHRRVDVRQDPSLGDPGG